MKIAVAFEWRSQDLDWHLPFAMILFPRSLHRFLPACLLLCLALALASSLVAQPPTLRLPHIFGDRGILQRDKPLRIWGWSAPGAEVSVRFGGQEQAARASAAGAWGVELPPFPASAVGKELEVSAGGERVVYKDILVGDVWLLGGQSNMEAALRNIQGGELEILSADLPELRLMTIPLRAAPEPADDFPRLDEYNSWSKVTERKGDWQVCSPDSVPLFSAIGFVFGRRLHEVTGVPVGLIDTSWGGTTVEAWISRKSLAAIPETQPLLDQWDAKIAAYDPVESLAQQVRNWEGRAAKAGKEGKSVPAKPTEPKPSPAVNRNNPGAAYNAIIHPIAPYVIKGALFYQGINNAVGAARPSLYAKTFAELIPEWRRTFRDPALPFAFCQMVSWGFPPDRDKAEVEMVSAAPFIREAQLKAHRAHPDTGFVVAYDLGHIQMHSPYKVPIGDRFARWALATQYGVKLTSKTPLLDSSRADGAKMILTFDEQIHPRYGGRAEIEGFAISGRDRHFYPATARMSAGNEVEVWSEFVPEPVAVRYAWATHPAGTLVGAGSNGLPAAPFRTDDWEWKDAPFAERGSPEDGEHRRWIGAQRAQAEEWARQRRRQEAEATLKATAPPGK